MEIEIAEPWSGGWSVEWGWHMREGPSEASGVQCSAVHGCSGGATTQARVIERACACIRSGAVHGYSLPANGRVIIRVWEWCDDASTCTSESGP